MTRGEGGLLRRLFELAPDGMLVTRLSDGRIVMANDASAALLGRERGDLIARSTEEIGLWPEQDRDRFVDHLRDQSSVPAREIRLDTPTGTRFAEISYELTTMGGREHVIVTLHDVTDRKRADDALRAERDHYAALVAALQDAYYVVDQNGVMVDVNQRFCDLVGYSREDALAATTPGPWWPPSLHEAIRYARREVVEHGYAEFDWPVVRRNGDCVDGHVTSAVMHDADRNISGIVVTIRV